MEWFWIVLIWVVCSALCTGFLFEDRIAAWERKWFDFFAECREKGIPKSRILKGIILAIFGRI